MDKNKFLELSRGMNRIKRIAETFTNLHMYRFSHFVDSSPLGLDCRYADATLRGFLTDNEKEQVKVELRKMKRDIDTLLGELNDS